MKIKKKTVIIASIAFVVLLAGSFIWYNMANSKLKFSIDVSKVSSIEFANGSGDGWTITERADIEHIVNNLNSITFSKEKSAADVCGFTFSTRMLDKDGNELWGGVINSSSRIVYNDYFYIDDTSSVDRAYIEKLTKTMTPD